jgi:alkylhydroperoxidase family enzyme
VAHLPGTADEIRARVPAVLDAWEYMRDNVLAGGIVEPELKRLCFRFLADDPETTDPSRFTLREQLALRWAQAIAWDSDLADDALWAALHAEFSEPELVELGCSIGFALGQQHFERTLGLRPHAGLS